MADPEVQKADDLEKFEQYTDFLIRRETRKATRQLCELMEHSSPGCNCFQATKKEKPPELPRFTIIQPNPNFNNDHENTVASMFISSEETDRPSVKRKKKHHQNSQNDELEPPKPKKVYAANKEKERGTAEQRRDIKKKLFMDLGIVRTNSGIDVEEKKREEAMKRKVTETIVTTYCAECEQNFSSSKMLLLHRNKVHNTSTLECHLCLKRFDQTIHFNRHMKTHYGPNAQSHVQCDLCDRKFKDKDSLKTHMEVSHQSSNGD